MSHWERGNLAGHHFAPNGDLSVSVWVVSPRGERLILTTIAGFRDAPDGAREKVILDRVICRPPEGSIR